MSLNRSPHHVRYPEANMTRQLSRRKVVLSMVTKFDNIKRKDPRASQGYADINVYGRPKELNGQNSRSNVSSQNKTSDHQVDSLM